MLKMLINTNSLFNKVKLQARAISNRAGQQVLRPTLLVLDKTQATLWELRRSYRYHPLTVGEINSQLKRMGIESFRQYIFGQMLGHFGARNFLPTDKTLFTQKLRQQFPEQEEKIITQSNQLCDGYFDLLGSGVVDMKCNAQSAGWQLNWCKDPISGENYQNNFSHWRWNVFGMRPGKADIKGPWELTRCQHFVTLGHAYWLTNDERYAKCFAKTILDFIKNNPPGFGIHWACTMDVALRTVGWLNALSFFQHSKQLNYFWWKKFLTSLVEHGRFITNNLEFGTFHGKLIFSNHGISNLFGLYTLALNFPQLDAACVWRGIAETGLEQQIMKQILPDGGPFESSIPYQRLVLEMFLSAYALSKHHNLPLSDNYRERLIKGLRFVASLRQANGRVAQIGDADNGRAHIFSNYGDWAADSMDHLLVAGAQVLELPELADNIPLEAHIEGLSWPGEISVRATQKNNAIAVHKECGIASLKNGSSHITFANLGEGTDGVGNHKHCDQLAIEWCHQDQTIFVDAGSYTYTQDPKARNFHRSTAIHNTVILDNTEQHVFDPELLFSLQQQGKCQFGRIIQSDNIIGIEAHHTAYHRLSCPTTHTRRLLILDTGTLIIEDKFDNTTEISARWNFLLYPGLKINNQNDLVIQSDHADYTLHSILDWNAQESWYSPGYGQRIKTTALVNETLLAPDASVVIMCQPSASEPITLNQANSLCKQFWQNDRSSG